ncbi:PAS domain S-box-containing protein [Sporomusaceae bacterium BoRhaA]|uniref:sigma-54 interaction domain-containing protein n=1 Tax=Pelorhabdus rhamnosifermentans TaxID=2772457 RepID=UPI001C063071|nr:sigma 54-interacting transcriptional regulator [Pelorhabdus rhamnosifermentans]MBU2699219.1 PAS domain S-box-containing protein [Pelorhabdus rhamnosifermentans]
MNKKIRDNECNVSGTEQQGQLEEFEAIINSSYDGIFITDGQGKVLHINHAYERITGIKAEEIIGQTMTHLVARKFYDQSVTVLVIEQRKRITINQTVRGTHQILVTGNPIFDKQGNLYRVVTNVRDITELVNLRDQLREKEEQTLKYKAELSHLRALQVEEKELVFRSSAMARAVELATKIAEVDSTVLITGESGTGKELIAKLIHKRGKGLDKPFIKVNCAAIPETLIESELFGYEGGAFTGARREGKPGLFELAHGGTLFLDEVGDLPLAVQVKLLRVLQEKEVVRVGSGKAIKVDVRIISATHRDIGKMVKNDQFREDLYYRLMVIPLQLTSLRDRKEDIPVLIPFFLDKFNAHFGFHKVMAPQTVAKLVKYAWPGNVRELENLIERLMVTAPGDELTEDLLPTGISERISLPKSGTKLKEAVEQTEIYLLSEAFKKCGSWAEAAEMLGIDRATVFRKVTKYGLKTKKVAKLK